MVTRIDFYQLSGDETSFACRLIANVYRKRHQIYVHTATEAQANALDEQLWSFRPDSFIPHSLQSGEAEPGELTPPVSIGFDQEPSEHQDVLINLSGEIPPFFTRFDRVAEIVPANKNSREAARKHYAFYKAQGYAIQYHDMG